MNCSGHTEGSFDNPAENIPQNFQKRWGKYSKVFFSSNRSSGHPESSFHNPTMKHLSTGSESTAESQKKIKIVVFCISLHFRKTFLRTCGLKFWQPCPKYFNTSLFYLLKNRYRWRKVFSWNNNFKNHFLRGRRIQCWQRCQFFSAIKPNPFCWMS